MNNGTVDPFGAFDDAWEKTPESERGAGRNRLPPAVYKFVTCTHNVGQGEEDKIVDHEVIDNRTKGGTIGIKIFCEVLLPEEVMNEKTGEADATKGKVLEHVFWVSEKTIGFVKRDVKSIIGRDIVKASELTKIPWAGFTFEAGVQDETRDGYINSRIKWINPWSPQPAGAPAQGTPPTPAKAAPVTAPAATGGTAAAAPKKEGVKF